ncbi:MAG: PIG-L family deacetylase [Methylococcales bacterium]|nr:PIG-L family deacetylase [Methylococcales bacterium]
MYSVAISFHIQALNTMYLKVLFFVLLNSLSVYSQAASSVESLNVQHAERLVILAPHPDDETLSAAGLAHRVLEKGGSVRSVVVTAGDAYVEAIQHDLGKKRLAPIDFLRYGKERLDESRHAANLLGKGSIKLDLLGFPDGSIYPMLISHWNNSNPDKSEFTGFSHIPYIEAEDRGHAQDGKFLREELVKILKEMKPTLIAFPDVMENDSDHAGLGMFALLAINDWFEQTHKLPSVEPRLLTYLIHWKNDYPSGANSQIPVDLSNQPLFLPDELSLRHHIQTCFNLNVLEKHLKRATLEKYQSQQRAMGNFLMAFVRRNECFTRLNEKDTQNIENIVRHWQQTKKKFDANPISRQYVLMDNLKLKNYE